MAKAALETVLRRDRIVVAAALAGLAALAWGYVLWLGADMNMDGMDMSGFRMIPAGLGIMAPANAPWKAIEFASVFAMVRRRLFPGLDRFVSCRDGRAMDARALRSARRRNGERQ